MASESIRFDFLTAGGAEMARQFKSVGDTAAAAARGAEVLKRNIDSLGQKENRTAEESTRLAKALRLTGDAEDRAAAKALGADIAIRRLADAEAKAARNADTSDSRLSRLGKTLSGLKAPTLGTGLTLLAPTLIPAIGGLLPAVGAVTASLAGAGVVAGSFAALAKTAFSSAGQDATKLAALQQKLADATTARQRKNITQQITDLEKGWSSSYTALVTVTGKIQAQWRGLARSVATPVLVPWLDAVSRLLGHMRPLVQPVADLFKSWGQDINRYFASKAGSSELQRMAAALGRFGADQMSAIGVFITDLARGVFNLGRDLAAHNVDFGAFSVHLDQWGGAFRRWSDSAAARHDVTALLEYVRSNGPVVSGLLKNLGGFLAKFAPGLTSAGTLELRLVSGFIGFVAKLPSGVAKPLLDVAGALLLLQKTGVISVGVKVIGPALKWLTGGVINIGGGASAGAAAGAEIRAAFASGGAAAAAEIRAAMTGGGAAAGAEGSAGVAAGAATQIKSKLPGLLVPVASALGPILGGVTVAALAKAIGDTLSPKGTFAGRLNHQLQSIATTSGGIFSTNLLHSFTFGGLEAWLTAKVGLPFGKVLNDIGAGAKTWAGNVTRTITHVWGVMTNDIAKAFDIAKNLIGIAWDDIELAALRTVRYTLNLFGHLPGPLGAPFREAARSISGSMAGVQADIARRTRQIQADINSIHGKSVDVHLIGTAGGTIRFQTTGGTADFPIVKGSLTFRAAGGLINRGSGPTADDVPAMLSRGELVVPTAMVKAGAVDHLRGKLPGFAAGGIAGGVPFMADTEAAFGKRAEAAFAAAAIGAAKRAAAAAAAASAPGSLGGPTSASAAQAQAYASSRLGAYGWSPAQMKFLIALWNRESGWNRFARNPSSGAYGIPQALPPSKMGAAANPPTSSAAAQVNWGLGYIRGRYGSPQNAWAHELSYGWYDRGGWLRPGLNLALNTSGRPEQVIPASAGAGGRPRIVLEVCGTGSGTFDAFLLKWIQEHVRIRGGGSVEKAFGRR